MSSKTEERLKSIIKEYLDERQDSLEKVLIEKTMGIFLVGTVAGILLAYTSIAPLTIGLIVGYTIAKRNVPIIDHYLLSHLSLFMKKSREMISTNYFTESARS